MLCLRRSSLQIHLPHLLRQRSLVLFLLAILISELGTLLLLIRLASMLHGWKLYEQLELGRSIAGD